MHIYTLCPSLPQSFMKFYWAVSEDLCWLTVLSSIFHFGQTAKFKKGITLRKKLNQNFLWICTSTWYVLHNYKVSWNSVERFQKSCADKLFQKYLSFWSNFYVQKGRNSKKKKLNQNSLWICASTHYVLYYYKVSQNSFERCQWSCAD